MSDTDTQIEMEIEALAKDTEDAVLNQAVWAYSRRKNRQAMKKATFRFGRKASNMAKAVRFFPEEFENEPTFDQCLAMFAMASAGEKKAKAIAVEWKKRKLDAWQVWELVNVAKKRAPRSSNCKEKELYALLRKIREGLNEKTVSDNEIIEWIDDALANE